MYIYVNMHAHTKSYFYAIAHTRVLVSCDPRPNYEHLHVMALPPLLRVTLWGIAPRVPITICTFLKA